MIGSSVASTNEMLLSRQISVSELVEATLAHIERTEPVVHAFAHVMHDEARRAASELDIELAKGQCRGQLHGIPIGVKDNICVAGAPLQAGSASLVGFRSEYDADVVSRLRKAGAVIIGKTVTHELALAPDRGDGPEPRNPWSTDRSPGGSSAGSGIAPVIHSSFAAIGTDTAGSVRGPAAWCGAVGLKPTFGAIERHGVVPLSSSLDHVGIIARTAEDCAAVFRAVRCEGGGGGSSPPTVPSVHTRSRIGISPSFGFGSWAETDVLEAVSAAVEVMRESLDAEILEIDTADLEPAVPIGLIMVMSESCAQYRLRVASSPDQFSPTNRVLLQLAESIPAWVYSRALDWRHRIRDRMRRLFEAHDLDVLVSPTYPISPTSVRSSADNQHQMARSLPDLVRCTLLANVTGQPAVSIPCGFTPYGLPVGLHLIGRPNQEDSLLALASEYDRCTEWSKRKPGLIQTACTSSQPSS